MDNKKRRSIRGEYLVETALVLLPFVLTVTGVLDLGQMLFLYETCRERARAGTRYAAVHDFDTQAIKNFVVYNSSTGNGPALFGLRTSMVTVTRSDQGTLNDRIEVQIANYPMTFLSPLLAKYHLHPVFRTVMPIESLGATD